MLSHQRLSTFPWVWSYLGPWVKCTRNGARNSASSGIGVRGAWGNRAGFVFLVIMLPDYRRFTEFNKVVLGDIGA